ncbi:MAG: DUF6058 family natural product biosynthesis protein [Chryseobacterium sp.]|uniref:DUF6058 family natural product biosynthesis protein n=1 Tax=Chryseobacterium sp. TaxID=1871047 RepID=UPI0025B8B85D|nr:DUF6058 family natural product biosynthesis protein [Chryseobacterium sp.]MCJ7935273.1 DUF6058 family natural product biosynthesis protein [Chryseobacterium sp.]
MDQNFNYINDHYITEEELCSLTDITKDELAALIQNQLVPQPSYVITRSIKITSPLNDKFQSEITEKYFSKNCISLIKKNKDLQDTHQYKEEFKEKFIQNLTEHPDKNFAYGNIFKDSIPDPEKLNEAFESEWSAYCDGIYGICTLNSTEEEIVKKEIAVKKLIQFNTLFSKQMLAPVELAELMKLNEEFNEVAQKFAPYQRSSSSRGKYLDQILENNNLNYLVKKY